VSSIGVADSTQILVKAADKGRAAADSALELQDGAIDLLAEFDHGIRFVYMLCPEKLNGESSKHSLRGDQDLPGLLAPPAISNRPKSTRDGPTRRNS
jgi:hypothetical protein